MAFGAGVEGGRRQARDHVACTGSSGPAAPGGLASGATALPEGPLAKGDAPRVCNAPALCDAERGGACQLASCGRLQRRQERSGGAGARAQEGAGQRPREGSGRRSLLGKASAHGGRGKREVAAALAEGDGEGPLRPGRAPGPVLVLP